MLGVIGGSGLSEFSELKVISEELVTTPYGDPSTEIVVAELLGRQIAFLARHGRPHKIPPHRINYRANVWALKSLGVDSILAVNATGGISARQKAGVISLPDQIIDYSYGREHTFSDGAHALLQHIDFTSPYSRRLQEQLLRAAAGIDLTIISGGVHGVMQGPRLETAAEIRRMANDGCDIVGMTGMPEAALASEIGIEYVCISLVVNRAAGLSTGVITMTDMEKVMKSGMQDIKRLIAAFCSL